ncbi:MAG: hypothetical protein HSCHL_2082 [Hydrogenibacillus schlegelii]|uniref:Uncharacterized protein n=1 Tax=Hydrogenibacillus schlegelii TaxID=1484 RepID=A0A2T5GB89_HYDSH|nr:MAG: hypothetical protein HSCHL_2082 [Hydrogenibacillus schlegelii]
MPGGSETGTCRRRARKAAGKSVARAPAGCRPSVPPVGSAGPKSGQKKPVSGYASGHRHVRHRRVHGADRTRARG